MAIEKARGCGFRKVNGLYLCGEGAAVRCDRLPFRIVNCPVCSSGLKFTRAFTWLDWEKYAGKHITDEFGSVTDCKCLTICPVCQPEHPRQPYCLLWIGERYYSPEAFIRESLQMGVSRRLPFTGNIPRAPRLLKLNVTWVLFAHKHVIYKGKDEKGVDIYEPAIFHAFKPTRLELLIWQKDATEERLAELEKAGITSIIIPDGDLDHSPESPLGLAKDDKEELENRILFTDLRNRLKK